MNQLRLKATELRDAGYSYNMIKNEIGVSISTLSNWFSDRPYAPNQEVMRRIAAGPFKAGQLKHEKKVHETKITIEEAILEIGIISERDLWLLGLGVYIGEGTKSIESVRIVNSDPEVIKLSMRWFRESLGLEDENFAVSINVYPDNDINASIAFWSDITNLPTTSFKKTQIDVRKGKSKKFENKLPYGTLQIRIRSNGNPENGVKLFRRIKGWTKGVVSQV